MARATHVRLSTHRWEEPYLSLLLADTEHCRPLAGMGLISRPNEGRWLSWPGYQTCTWPVLGSPTTLQCT